MTLALYFLCHFETFKARHGYLVLCNSEPSGVIKCSYVYIHAFIYMLSKASIYVCTTSFGTIGENAQEKLSRGSCRAGGRNDYCTITSCVILKLERFKFPLSGRV